MSALRYVVRCLDIDGPTATAGAVMLDEGVDELAAEAALRTVGVYAPRGPERIVWGAEAAEKLSPLGLTGDATVLASDGTPTVVLTRDTLTRSERFRQLMELYPPASDWAEQSTAAGELETDDLERFALVQQNSDEDNWLTTHTTRDDAEVWAAVAQANDGPPVLMVDLDSGETFDPIVEVRFQRRATSLADDVKELRAS